MRQNNYYKLKNNAAISYSFRTRKAIMYRTKNDVADSNMTLEWCEDNVKKGVLTQISYKEFLDLLNQNEKPVVESFADKVHKAVEETHKRLNISDSRYFVRNGIETDPYYKFLECKPDKSVIAHISKTETYKSAYSSDVVITNKCWKEITKTEAFKLFDELPVVKADTVIPPENEIVYYDNVTGFKDKSLFISVNKKTGIILIHNKDDVHGSQAYGYVLKDCENYVKDGQWKHITKEQAYDKLKAVTDKKPALEIESSPTPDKKIQLPEINFFILVKKGTLGTLYFKYVDPKNWTWVDKFDECTKFSTTFLHGEKFKQIKDNLIDPLLQKDKQKLHWIQMAATKVQETQFFYSNDL